MVELGTLSEVQLVLLRSLVNGVYLQLHSGDGLLHGGHRYLHRAHPPLNGSQSLHDLRIVDLRFRRRDGLGGGSHVRKTNKHGSRYGHLIIGVISSQLSIGLHQSLLADGLLNLHLRFSNNIDPKLKNDLSE